MAKKKQLQTNGKVESLDISALEQFFGTDATKYTTTDEETYLAQLDGFTKSDLDEHARAIGITIPEGVPQIKNALLKQFRIYANSTRRPPPPVNRGPTKITPEIARILAEGK